MLLRRQTAIPLLILPLVLGACSLFGKKDDVFDYRTAPRPTRLDVPPDLSQLPKDDRFVVPTPAAAAVPADGAKGASPATPVISPAAVAAVAAPALPAGSVAPANAVARVVQSGKERWLEADAAPELVYAHLRTLWEHAGWKIAVDDPAAGVLETDWKGSRPAPQEDSIRGTLHRLLGALDSPGEQSRLRARFERQGASRTIVHVSERLIVEMPANTQSDHTIWVPKDPTGELEAETLQRLANDLAPVGSIPVVPTVAVAAMAASADATAPAVAPAAAPDANVPTPAGPAGAAHRVNVGGL